MMSFRNAYGNAWSENGWRMCNRDECVLVPGPYMATAPLRRGPAEVILGDFVRRHHTDVEPIVSSVWAWSQYNDVGNSNHLAGTSVDVRAPYRPWGALVLPKPIVDRTYGLLERYKINGESGIKWGREWNRHDEMHFQLNWKEGDPRNDELVRRILGQPSAPGAPVTPPAPPVNYAPILRYGSSGAAVSKLQADMNRIFSGYEAMPLIVDGDFGPGTRAAVVEFQRRVSIADDGEVGPQTWAQLAKYGIKY